MAPEKPVEVTWPTCEATATQRAVFPTCDGIQAHWLAYQYTKPAQLECNDSTDALILQLPAYSRFDLADEPAQLPVVQEASTKASGRELAWLAPVNRPPCDALGHAPERSFHDELRN